MVVLGLFWNPDALEPFLSRNHSLFTRPTPTLLLRASGRLLPSFRPLRGCPGPYAEPVARSGVEVQGPRETRVGGRRVSARFPRSVARALPRRPPPGPRLVERRDLTVRRSSGRRRSNYRGRSSVLVEPRVSEGPLAFAEGRPGGEEWVIVRGSLGGVPKERNRLSPRSSGGRRCPWD